MIKSLFANLFAVLLLLSAPFKDVYAQVALDSVFRGTGFSLHTYPGATAAAHTVLRNGKILTCGSGTSSGCLYRFRDTGSIDNSFGGGGNGALDIFVCGMPLQMAKLSGDTVLLYGQAGTGYAMVKLDSAGNFSSDFGTNGSISRSIPVLGYFGCTPTALAVQADGKIVITASANTAFPPTVVMRLLPNGDYDSTFGSGGYTYLPFGSCGFTANRIFMQSTGKIIVTGDYYTTNSNPFYGACRLRSDGVVDSTYGTNGEVHSYVNINSRVSASCQQADEKLILAGSNGYMLRYTPNGVLDTIFQAVFSNYRTTYQYKFGSGCIPSDILDDAAGRHYVYGRYQANSGSAVFYWYYVMRLTPDGLIDSSFNGTGYFDYPVRTPTLYPQSVTTRSMLLLPGNKLLLYGDVWYYSTGKQIFLSQLYIHPNLEVVNSGRPTNFCAGDTARLLVHTSGSVRWLRNGALLSDTGRALQTWQSGNYVAVTTYLNGKAHDTSNSLVISFHTPAVPVVSSAGNSLRTNSGGAMYQWYDSSKNAIAGATDSVLIPSAAGTYFVTVTDSNGCTAESASYPFTPLGLSYVSRDEKLFVYPNPVHGQLYVVNKGTESLMLSFSDMAGRILWQQTIAAGATTVIKPEQAPAQNYLLQARGEGRCETQLVRME